MSRTTTPAAPSADGLRRAFRVRAVLHSPEFSPAQKFALLALNAWPIVHLGTAAAIAFLAPAALLIRILSALAWLLFAPPLLCRLIGGNKLPTGEFHIPTAVFFRWWCTWQLQSLFNRLPWMEETLRFVPGLYSAWLRLWGAKIGRLTLWSPGVKIFDRPLLRVGHDVVVGIDARLVSHFSSVNSSGATTLTLGPVTLADRTSVGGCALLSAGFVLEADQATEALFLGAPFTRWRAGQRVPSPSTESSPKPAHL